MFLVDEMLYEATRATLPSTPFIELLFRTTSRLLEQNGNVRRSATNRQAELVALASRLVYGRGLHLLFTAWTRLQLGTQRQTHWTASSKQAIYEGPASKARLISDGWLKFERGGDCPRSDLYFELGCFECPS